MNNKFNKILHSLFLIFNGITFGGLILLPFITEDSSKIVYDNPYIISYLLLWVLTSLLAIYYKE